MPWCHVYIGHVVSWERCRLDSCPDQAASECVSGSGGDYRGTMSHSVSGRVCLSWDSEELRPRLYNAWSSKAHQLGLGSHRYCRNPSGDSEPWCYIRKGRRVIKEHCGIQSCDPEVEICGKREPEMAQFRILGGSPADISSNPWQVAILTFNRREKSWNFLCGGSLIRSCWVVSAAHCFENRSRKPGHLRVALGRTVSWQESAAEQLLQVDDYFLHKDFDSETYDHDIALLQLRSQDGVCARPTRQVRPVCLPRRGQRLADWMECEISGYGRETRILSPTDDHKYSKQLKAANVRLYPQSQCTPARLENRTVTGNMICAGDTVGTNDACKGDSGGPLVCLEGDRMRLQGVISWGVGCGKKGVPGVYTKVQNYLDWMQKLMTAPDISKYKSHHWKE
ncbi:tissue-type plasminogen activator [Leucoraja erinacea]|uniref:tissue-type plasminogen activator n=1 Tax=Leucoraja erinaceus TaxID=7782 RepID=UPI00245907FD|nr:tissue-type plasminogen activator [Leucoraja erinacea]